MSRRPPLGTLAVVVVLAAGTAVANAVGTPQRAASTGSESVEVVGATAVCPYLRQWSRLISTRVSVGAAQLPADRVNDGGAVSMVRLTGRPAPQPVPVTEPGQVVTGLGRSVDQDGVVVTASGVLAAGLEVEQVTRGERLHDRGLAGLRCEPPRNDVWFAGGATQIGDKTLLMLANVDDTPATVDVTVFARAGEEPPDPRLGQGVTVQPHSRKVVSLDELAPGRQLLAVHVAGRRGRVAAGLRHARAIGRVGLGVDWVPQSVPPAARVVVPGFPSGDGSRTLQITNPNDDDVVATVQLTTKDSQFVPSGMAAITVPARSVISVDMTRFAKESPLGITVTSEGGPVLAGGLVVDAQDGPVREFAYTTGSLPLSGPALLTDLTINRPTESTLILTAPEGTATVVVTPVRLVGSAVKLPPSRTIVVAGGRTATLRLSTLFWPGSTVQLALEVRPQAGSGPVYAARYLRERGATGPLTTLLDLQGPAQRVSRPPVELDQRLGS